jgi:2-polyprenyl-3-methyl-5-hydroxy-6-metoxy-1,4-benzoquinol methylase
MSEADNTSLAVRRLYDGAPWLVRWHVRTRLRLCPYDRIVSRLPVRGTVLDVGCGFGHFCWYLAIERPNMSAIGCDLDDRKIAVARSVVAPEALRPPDFRLGRAEDVVAKEEPFAGITVLDVLYLLPLDGQRALVEWCAQQLTQGGVLVIKALDTEARWRARRALLEEWIMVRLLRKTASSNERFEPQSPEEYSRWLGDLGLAPSMERLKTMNPSALIWGVK